MCGIIGTISFEKHKHTLSRKDVMLQAFVTGTVRGTHSTGLFAVNAAAPTDGYGRVLVYKKDVAGYDFIQLKQADRIISNMGDYKFFVGHHRHATYGSISPKNAHPFTYDNITLVHNGSLTHLYDLSDQHSRFDVDSEVLTYAIATKGYEEVFKKLKGAAAVVWYDSNTDELFLYRNKERPLFFAKIKDSDIAFIGSETWMLKGLIWRNGLELEKIYDVGENQVVAFKDKAIPHFTKEIEPEKPVQVAAVNDSVDRVIQGIFRKGGNRKETIKPQEVLNSLNLRIGDTIHFIIDEIKLPSKNSKHGEALGIRTVDPYPDVSCQGVDSRKFKPKDIVKAEVVGVKMADHMLGVCIVTKSPKKVGENKRGAPWHSNVLQLPLVRQEDVGNLLKGPKGDMVTIDVFKKLVESGCDNCQGNINPLFADKTIWTNADKPICHVCSEKLTSSGAVQH